MLTRCRLAQRLLSAGDVGRKTIAHDHGKGCTFLGFVVALGDSRCKLDLLRDDLVVCILALDVELDASLVHQRVGGRAGPAIGIGQTAHGVPGDCQDVGRVVTRSAFYIDPDRCRTARSGGLVSAVEAFDRGHRGRDRGLGLEVGHHIEFDRNKRRDGHGAENQDGFTTSFEYHFLAFFPDKDFSGPCLTLVTLFRATYFLSRNFDM